MLCIKSGNGLSHLCLVKSKIVNEKIYKAKMMLYDSFSSVWLRINAIVSIFFLEIDQLCINCKNCEGRNAQNVCFNFSSKETVLVKGLLGTKQPFYALINSIRHTGWTKPHFLDIYFPFFHSMYIFFEGKPNFLLSATSLKYKTSHVMLISIFWSTHLCVPFA